MPSWLVSMVLHVLLILVLTLIYLPNIPVFNNDLTIGRPDIVDKEMTNFEESLSTVDMDVEVTSDVSVEDAPEIPTEDPALMDEAMDQEAAAMEVVLNDIGFESADSTDLMQELGSITGSGLEGRSAAERTRLLREAGGTEGSEEAVKRALQWIKRHQSPDGGWNFYHLGGRCSCKGPRVHGRSPHRCNGTGPVTVFGSRKYAPDRKLQGRRQTRVVLSGQLSESQRLLARARRHHVLARLGRHCVVRSLRDDRRSRLNASCPRIAELYRLRPGSHHARLAI